MSYYHGGWAPYVPVAERRRKAEREMEKLRKRGVAVSPVRIEGRKIAATFWGKAWCENLESYRDYENRLERGRTYVRNGSVVDLQIAPRAVTAMVSGSSIYKVKVTISELAKARWKAICADCAGGIDSLVELLQGRLSRGVMERICRQRAGLFPQPSEIRFSCSCPDFALMCKHVAAVLYGVGARLDASPELLFRLRSVDANELVADIGQALPSSKRGPGTGKVLETDDMAALFGLDMAAAGDAAGAPAADKPDAGGKAKIPAKAKAKATRAERRPPARTRPPSGTKVATRTATSVKKTAGSTGTTRKTGAAPKKTSPSAGRKKRATARRPASAPHASGRPARPRVRRKAKSAP